MRHGVRPPEFVLPDEAHVGGVRLQVADLARSLEFYEGAIGLTVQEEGGGSARLGVPGSPHALVSLEERPGAAPVPRRGRLGLFHFAILLPDRAALGRYLSHLADLDVPIGASDHLVSEALYLNDPDGLGIEIYADRPREAWQWSGSELRMATEPLDHAAVLGAAGSEGWSGAPAGTTMGHVHLHVGDLHEGERFYHRGLGLDKVVWSYPGALFLSAGGYHHHLGINTWARGSDAAGDDDARLLDWELVLPTADAIEACVTNLASQSAIERGAWGVTARDPWGTAVRLVVWEGMRR